MDITYHYPPELMGLLVDTLPLLCKSKRDLILFLKGAGIGFNITRDIEDKVKNDRSSISKYEIARTVLQQLNEKGEKTLRERREVLKRTVEFEDFSVCWESDRLKAEGLVAKIQKVVNIKDSFTRMKSERDQERKKHISIVEKERQKTGKRKVALNAIQKDLSALFAETNPWRRGKKLEEVLNNLFCLDGILIKEAFTIKGNDDEGVVEQIDGVIEINQDIYLVEMKWWSEPIGTAEISQHLVRVYHRGQARGIFISFSGYTPAGIKTCIEALQKTVVVLCELKEIVNLLEKEDNLKDFFKTKIQGAIIYKQPLIFPLENP